MEKAQKKFWTILDSSPQKKLTTINKQQPYAYYLLYMKI